jgi:anti-anti-sigma factor
VTTASTDRLICVVPPQLTSDAQRSFLQAAECALGTAASLQAAEVTLDLSHVERADAAGLGLLVMTHRRAQSLGVRLVLGGVTAELLGLLVAAGLDRLFSFARAA